MQFLERTPNMHTLMLHDGWHLAPAGGNAAAARTRSRGHPVKEKGGVMGGGSAGAPKKSGGSGSGSSGGVVRRFPDERRVLEKLEQHLPSFLSRNASTLVHLELAGLLLSDWPDLFRLLKRCTNLQRLYLRQCNIGDKNFETLSPVLRAALPALNHLQLAGAGLSALSGSLLAGLIKVQAEKRNTMHWATHLRQDAAHTPAPSVSMLLPNNLAAQGLVSLDVSGNALGDRGVALVAQALARDSWVKGVDLSGNGVGEEGLRAIVAMMEENQSLLWIQVQGSRDLNAHPGAAAGAGADEKEKKAAFVPRVGQSPSQRALESLARTRTSSAKLLAQFDPHAAKRAKRVLLLFHAQILDTQKFLTGREPLPVSSASAAAVPSSSPRGSGARQLQQQPLAPGAQHIFDAFFHPAAPPALHNGSFDNDSSGAPAASAAAAASARPRSAAAAAAAGRAASASGSRVAPGSNELLSPSIRSMAAARLEAEEQQQQFSFAGVKQRGSSRSRSRSPLRATAHISERERAPHEHGHGQRAALAFLFPHLALVCTPDRLLQPDVSLRGKPARTDNSWPAGYKPPPSGESGSASASASAPVYAAGTAVAPVPAGSPLRVRPASATGTGALSTPHSARRPLSSSPSPSVAGGMVGTAVTAPPARPDPLQSHLDFRPLLRETCVASTAEYVAAEKAAYKRRLRAAHERDLAARLDDLGRSGASGGAAGGPLRLRLAAGVEEEDGGEGCISVRQHQSGSGLHSPSGGSAAHSRLHSPLHSPLQLRSPVGPRTPHVQAGGAALSPLGGPIRSEDPRLPELEIAGGGGGSGGGSGGGAQLASEQADVVAQLLEENRRMKREMERLESAQREREQEQQWERERDRAHTGAVSSSSHPSHAHADAAVPAPAPAPRRFPHLPSPDDPFDVACMPALLSAASVAAQSPVQDPELLAYLETQFAKLHAYMDLMDATVEPAMQQQQQQQSQQQAAPGTTTERTEHHYSEPQHHSSTDGDDALSRSQPPSVERVERSPSPSPLVSQSFAPTATSDPAAGADTASGAPSGVRPVISRSGSFDGSLPEPAPAPASAPVEPQLSHAAVAASSPPTAEAEAEESVDVSSIQEELQAGVAERISDMFGLDEDE